MDDDSCEFKYIEIVPLDSNVEQTEDLKPFEVKVCFITNLVNHESKLWSSGSILACGAPASEMTYIVSSGALNSTHSRLRCEWSHDRTHTTVLCCHKNISRCAALFYGLHIYCSA